MMTANTPLPDDNQDIILTQWKTCVEMANATSQRRDAMNNIFITLNLAIAATVSFVWDLKSLFVLAAGIVVCVLWRIFIRNFRLLNAAKFDVINELEDRLPAKPFQDEWEKLQKTKKYVAGSLLEVILPNTFICLYAIAIVVILVMKLAQ